MDSSDDPLAPTFAPLWARLRGQNYLWHRTSLTSLEGILRDGAIVPNGGQFAVTWPQSTRSYARHLNAVALFDFDTVDEPKIDEHKWKWRSVLTNPREPGVIIRIQRDRLDRAKLLLPNEISAGDSRLDVLPDEIRRGYMVIPAVEALHLGPMPISACCGLLLSAIEDGQRYLWHEAAFTDDGISELTEVGREWIADDARRTAERHARGEYSIAERLEAAIKKHDASAQAGFDLFHFRCLG